MAVLIIRGIVLDPPDEAFDRPLHNGVLPLGFLGQAYATGSSFAW